MDNQLETFKPAVMKDDTTYPVLFNVMPNPFETPLKIEPMMINPFKHLTKTPYNNEELGVAQNESNQSSGFVYNKFYITRVVMIPSIIMMVFFSLLLVYIIIRHLRPIMKLYMSVIFYALSILYFAIQIIILLLHDLVNLLIK